MIDVKQISKLLKEITEKQKLIKSHNENKILEEDAFTEDIGKFQAPVIEQLKTIPEAIDKLPDKLSSTIDQPLQAIDQVPVKAIKFIEDIKLNPDKDLDKQYLQYEHFKMPSELMNSATESEISDIVQRVDMKLKSLGGRKARSTSMDKLQLDAQIEKLRNYKNRIKLIPTALELHQGTGFMEDINKDLYLKALYQNDMSKAIYQNDPSKALYSTDELVEKLHLNIGSIQSGNNSIELRNETVDILDILLNKQIIDKNEHRELYERYLSK